MNRPVQCRKTDGIVATVPPPRPKFDTLFADPRHFRGDCRLARTAIRRGWIKPEGTDAFVERFEQVTTPSADGHSETDYHWRRVRGGVYLMLEMEWANDRTERYTNPFGWPERATGRPRRWWYVSDAPTRLDAAGVWASLRHAGGRGECFDVSWSLDAKSGTDRVRFIVSGNGVVYIRCPQCEAVRRHLYFTKCGIGCRGCLGLRYGAPAAVRRGKRGEL